jgi:four helix bundle protein
MKENVLREKSYNFALRSIKLYRYLCDENKEYVLSKQILRSGTLIGANIEEALQGESKADFIHKLSIALKEASETNYWLRLLRDSGFLKENQAQSLLTDCEELQKLLTAIIKTSKN